MVPAAISNNRNASAAVATTPVGVLVVWFIGNVLHLEISGEIAVVITGLMISVVLALGRCGKAFLRLGIRGVWRGLLDGFGNSDLPPPPPPGSGV